MTIPPPSGVRAAVGLGLAGLIPFFAAGVGVSAPPGPWTAFGAITLLAYAATIASFLGGVRWGVEIVRAEGPRPAFLLAGVLPQIAAFGLVAAPLSPEWRYGGLALLLLAQGACDWRADDLPDWYRRLRLPLTAGAVAACLAGFWWVMALRPR